MTSEGQSEVLPVLIDDPMTLPKSADPHDVPPWRPTGLHVGVDIRFTEPDGRSYAGHVSDEVKPGDTLEKVVRRLQREAVARAIEFGFKYERHTNKGTDH